MGIYTTGSPNDMKNWLMERAKSLLLSGAIIYEHTKNAVLTKWQTERLQPLFRQFFANITQIVDFAYETKKWREEVVEFIMQNGVKGVEAFLYLLSKNEPPTTEKLTEATWEIASKDIKEIKTVLTDGFLILKRSFNDIIIERYDSKASFMGSIVMNTSYGANFEKRGGIQAQLEALKIVNVKDKEKTMRMFKQAYEFLLGKLSWGVLVRLSGEFSQ